MAENFEEINSTGPYSEDEQITIKIPNPNLYMARQSHWVSRRGKPRCDHCRVNNLKCDRVLPACNHCSWAAGRECKYTPLPTPAHRGIPRCDRCRLQNLKCDRNLPVCNYCKDTEETTCNYTPKKRRKVLSDETIISDTREKLEPTTSTLLMEGSASRKRSSDRDVASSLIRKQSNRKRSLSSASESSEHPNLRQTQTGRFTAHSPEAGNSHKRSLPVLVPKRRRIDGATTVSASFDDGPMTVQPQLVPWTNRLFAPLPDFVIRGLASIDPAEFPHRNAFNHSLSVLLENMIPELRETSCLSQDTYAAVSRYLSHGDTSRLSQRMRQWASFHHLASGSNKFYLILVPRESIFQIDEATRQKYRESYCARIDMRAGKEREISSARVPTETLDDAGAFERLPVQDQLFDIISYAHASHSSPSSMFSRIRKMGFASITWSMLEIYTQLCPLCNSHNSHHGEESFDDLSTYTSDLN